MKTPTTLRNLFIAAAIISASSTISHAQELPTRTSAIETEDCCKSDFDGATTQKDTNDAAPDSKPRYKITLPKGDNISFTGLKDHNGNAITEEYQQEHFAGKTIMLYFGFPECTVFCPPATQILVEAVKAAEEDIVPVIVSSKKGRTPADMQSWLGTLGVNSNLKGTDIGAIGLSGGSEEGDKALAEIYSQLHVNDRQGNHIPYIAIINPEGEFLGGVRAIAYDKKAQKWKPDRRTFKADMEKTRPEILGKSYRPDIEPAP